MLAILTAFCGPIFHGMSNILDAHVAGKMFKKLTSVIFFNGLTNFLAVPFILFFGDIQSVPRHLVPYILLVNVIDVFYQFPYYAALKKVDTSIVAAMFSLGKIIIPILAWFMIDEKLYYTQYLGFGIVIFFNLLLNLETPKSFKINSGFWLMLGVSLMLSLQGVIYKKVLNELDWVTMAFWCCVLSNLMCISFAAIKSARKNIIADFPLYFKHWRLFLSLELLDQMGHLPGKFALSLMPVVVLKAINATQPLFVLIYGIILHKFYGYEFKENVSRRDIIKKTISFLFIIGGVVMVIGK